MTFRTGKLPLAVFLHATHRLKFLGCEPAQVGRITFVFEDPEGNGAGEQLDFELGALVPASALFASQTFLRKAMTQIKASQNTSKSERETEIVGYNTQE